MQVAAGGGTWQKRSFSGPASRRGYLWSKELLAAVSLLVWHHRLPRPELEGILQHLLHFY